MHHIDIQENYMELQPLNFLNIKLNKMFKLKIFNLIL